MVFFVELYLPCHVEEDVGDSTAFGLSPHDIVSFRSADLVVSKLMPPGARQHGFEVNVYDFMDCAFLRVVLDAQRVAMLRTRNSIESQLDAPPAVSQALHTDEGACPRRALR